MILSINLKRWSSQVVHCCTRLTVGLMIHTKNQWKIQRSSRWAINYIPRGITFFTHCTESAACLQGVGFYKFFSEPLLSALDIVWQAFIFNLPTWAHGKTGSVNVLNDVRTWQRRRSLPSTKKLCLGPQAMRRCAHGTERCSKILYSLTPSYIVIYFDAWRPMLSWKSTHFF